MALRGTNQEFARPYNRRIVLETIRLSGPVSRAAIARSVGLTAQTVSTIVRELEIEGLVTGERETPRGRGQPPTALTLLPEGAFAIGLLLNPVSIEAALINLAGDVIARDCRDLPKGGPDAAMLMAGRLVEAMRAFRPDGRILGVGVAVPGPLGVDGMSFVGPTTLEGWQGVRIRERLAEATGLPVFAGVDVAAAALGERLYGVGQGFGQFYYLYIGIGIGGRLVQDGAVLHGRHGNAGEIGHLPLVPGGDPCPCGNRGCLERYLSVEALGRRFKADDPVAAIDALLAEGSPDLDAWIEETVPLFRSALVAIENLFDPETVVIGGIAPEGLLARLLAASEPLPSSVAARSDRTAPRVILSPDGQDAVLRGAAALAVSGVLSPQFGLLFGLQDASGQDTVTMTGREVAA